MKFLNKFVKKDEHNLALGSEDAYAEIEERRSAEVFPGNTRSATLVRLSMEGLLVAPANILDIECPNNLEPLVDKVIPPEPGVLNTVKEIPRAHSTQIDKVA